MGAAFSARCLAADNGDALGGSVSCADARAWTRSMRLRGPPGALCSASPCEARPLGWAAVSHSLAGSPVAGDRAPGTTQHQGTGQCALFIICRLKSPGV